MPNLTIPRATISYTTQTYSLRGIGESDPIQEPALALYVDDVYQPRQLGSMVDFNDIERIEVLRGPQGTLYGRNSSAGALRIITADPGNEFRLRASLGYGSYNAVHALASTSGPLVREKLSASIAFLSHHRDGTAHDPTLHRDVNGIDVNAARVKLRWTPTSRWDILGTVNGLVDRSDSRSYIPAKQPNGFSPTSLAYQWTQDVLTYLTYARGFKSGGFDNRATNITLARTAFNPEFVNNYEAGIKTELLGHHLRANLAGFYNDYKDLQVSYSDPAFPGTSVRGNAGKAHTTGLELETDTRLPFGLSFQLSGGYLYAVYDRYKNAGGMGVNADGNNLLNAPRWNFNAGATYELPLPTPGFTRLAGDVQWASDFYSSALGRPQDRNPAQTFVNGSLGWSSDDEHVSVLFNVRNLLDTQRPVTTTFTPNTGVYYYNFPDPRTFLLTLKYQR